MRKQPGKKSFADIVHDVEILPPIPPPKRDRPGLYGDAVVDQQGRAYAQVADEVTPDHALEVARAGAVVVWDSCGCGGGCGLDWFDAGDVAAMVSAGVPDIRHKKGALGNISEWRSDAGAQLLLAEGDVRWGPKLR